MKHKKTVCLLLCGLLAVMPAGCGTGDSGNGKTEDGKQGNQETAVEPLSIQMTDTYTFTDPSDLTFDNRYVLTGDKNCKLLSDMSNMGYQTETIYDIIYENDGKPAGEYQYFVTADEAAAKDLESYYSSMGQNVTREGNVLYTFSDGDMLEATIVTFAGMGELSDETPEAYAEMMKSFNGLSDYEN